MDKRVNQRFDEPAVDGPDYVALVIEWEQTAIPNALEDQITRPTEARSGWRQLVDKSRIAKLPNAWKAASLVGVLALAGWGIHRLRAA